MIRQETVGSFRPSSNCARHLADDDSREASVNPNSHLDCVRDLLSKYEHPLMDFSAVEHADGIRIVIKAKNVTVPVHTYTIDLHPRDLESSQLQWTLERQIYDGLHDYIIEMFTHCAHTRD